MTLVDDLELLLIRHNLEIKTNTPLSVLAAHMVASLDAFEDSLLARASHPFFKPGQLHETARDPFADPVPRYVHVEDEPIPGVACPDCED